jgi:hypothetical protein
MNTYLIRRCGLPMAILLLGVMIAGCGDYEDTASDQAEPAIEAAKEAAPEVSTEVATTLTAAEEALVTKIAAVAVALEKAPDAAGAILEKYGLTAEEYEAEVYKIASNPALSAAFEKAKSQ